MRAVTAINAAPDLPLARETALVEAWPRICAGAGDVRGQGECPQRRWCCDARGNSGRLSVLSTETVQTPAEAVFLIAFLVPWSAMCVVFLTNWRGWLDRYAESCARSWWARRVTRFTFESYRSQARVVAVGGLALGIFAFVAEGIGIANGRIG